MNIYTVTKLFNKIQSIRVKLLAIYIMYIARQRFLYLFIDPVMACNLKCKMCYFSGKTNKKEYLEKGKLNINDFSLFAKSTLHRARKIQIGCGAEPTLYKHLVELVQISKRMNVPYISLTTNGNVLKYETLHDMVQNGLNEITISSHGIKKETYENLMQNASYDSFLKLLDILRDIKKKFPNFIIRLNYTINEDNVEELAELPKTFEDLKLNVIQIRPVQNLGDSLYQNFSIRNILECYDSIFTTLVSYCKKNDIKLIFPSKENLQQLKNNKGSENNIILDFVHVYITPSQFWHKDYNYKTESVEQYTSRTNFGLLLLKNIFNLKQKQKSYKTNSLNYQIK